jgi:hypothetical protein
MRGSGGRDSSEFLRKAGDRDQHESSSPCSRPTGTRAASDAKGRPTPAMRGATAGEDPRHLRRIVQRDELKHGESLESEIRVSATGNQLSGDWEARYKSALDELNDLKKLVSRMRLELQQAKEAAARNGGGEARVDEELLQLMGARAELHGALVAQMLEGVNNAVSLLRRNSELLKGYVEDCGLLANAVRKIDYTRLEPEQQQMLVELVDQTQPT